MIPGTKSVTFPEPDVMLQQLREKLVVAPDSTLESMLRYLEECEAFLKALEGGVFAFNLAQSQEEVGSKIADRGLLDRKVE
jgi:hypothetical protein